MPDISQFDQEFLTAGSQSAEGEKLAGLVQQNLTPEEQKRLEEIMPILEEFNMLILKAQTGEFPEGAEEMGLTNGQGVPEQGMMEGRVPQDMQNQQGMPPRPIEGQMPESAPDQGMQMGGGVAAGPVGVVNEQGADGSGVADDVPAESDGFVVNAAAVRKIGLRKINDMIQKAIKYAEEQGIQLDFGKTPVNAEEILVSNGEVVIPDVLARIIGYDELEKINALGDEETDEIIEEEEQSEEPMKEMPVSLKKGGSSWQTYLDEYQEGPFPAEDAQIKQTILDTMEPYEDSELEDLELYKRNYEKYWNPETALKKRGPKRRYIKKDDTKIRGPEWDEYLNEAVTYEVSDDVKEAIRRVLPAFKFELEKHDMYDAKQFDYWSKIESRSGEDKISGDKKDYGTFQVNMPLLKKIFKSDKHFKNFIKYYGPKATAATGMSPYFLRKLYLEDEESFKDLMVDDHATNLAVGLAGSLLPAVD